MRPEKYPWVIELLGRQPAKLVAVALANKMARIAWAVLAKGETYRTPTRSSSPAIAAAEGSELGIRNYVEDVQERRG